MPSREGIRAIGRIWLLTALAVLLSAETTWAQYAYTVTDLGTLGGNFPQPRALNESATVVGFLSSSPARAFSYSGSLADLGTLGGNNANAYGINDAGVVVGESRTAGGLIHAFRFESGVMTDLGTLGGTTSSARGINASGTIVGQSLDGGGFGRAFRYESGTMSSLGILGTSRANAINSSGVIVGQGAVIGGNEPFQWISGTTTYLGSLGGTQGEALAVNDVGLIAGWSFNASSQLRAFAWTSGTGMVNLGTFGGNESQALGLNNLNQVVGYATPAVGNARAFLWQGAGLIDLNTQIDPGANWELIRAADINEQGQITGLGIHNGEFRAFLLTPTAIPEPTTVAFFGLAAAGAGVAWWKRRRDRLVN